MTPGSEGALAIMAYKGQTSSPDKQTEAKWQGRGLAQGHTESVAERGPPAFHSGSIASFRFMLLSLASAE